jgi:hypothetical protein
MKRNFPVVIFIAGAILMSTCVALNKAAVPQQFNDTSAKHIRSLKNNQHHHTNCPWCCQWFFE